MTRNAVVASALLAVAMSGIGAGATGAVYKCTGTGGVPLYTDLPCKGGTLVDIRPGTADPAAIERLERERDRFAALALAEAQRTDDGEVDAVGVNRGSKPADVYGPDEGGSGMESRNGIVYAPIFVGARTAFHRVHEHRHRPHRFGFHRVGVTSTTIPRRRSMPVARRRELQPALRVTAMTWK